MSPVTEHPISAWRCEHCRRFQPPAIPSTLIYVDEIGDRYNFVGATKRRSRFTRGMVVCPPCRRAITGEGDQS